VPELCAEGVEPVLDMAGYGDCTVLTIGDARKLLAHHRIGVALYGW